ncbi:MAG: urea transporter [Myxococcota bacterium]
MARVDTTSSRSDGIAAVWGGFLRSYSQVLFSSSRLAGLFFLCATLVFPATAAMGALSVLVAMATTRALSLSDETGRLGLFGYNALLVGLGLGAAFELSWLSAGIVVGASVATVVMTAALHSATSVFSLPTLSIPFLIVVLAVLVSAPMMGLDSSFAAFRLGQDAWGLPGLVSDFLVSLGSIFFSPAPLAGVIVLVGLLIYSRIAMLLAIFGYLFAVAVGGVVVETIPMQGQLFLTITMIVVAIAMGGIWFVPSFASFAVVLAAGVVASAGALANYALFADLGFPILFLPLNLTIWMMLFAMRQRTSDAHPKAVDFMAGSPEENLSYFRTHVARFGAHYIARFRAPFLGEWVCTQGPDGEITHKGHWSHALDFEVEGRDGSTYEGQGDRLEDYHCYGLPVLAVADGTVVRVADDVEDNPIGEVNTHQNWGNYVLLYHGPGVYSLVAHLMPGSSQVIEGQTVRHGDELGRCGNSGRSPVPHLHFHIQSGAVVGGPTSQTELHDVVIRDDDQARLASTLVPEKGQTVRNLDADDQMRALFAFPEAGFCLEHDDAHREEITVDVDLANRRVLVSETDTRLFYDQTSSLFTVFDVIGTRKSGLHLMRMALGRVPFELNEDLVWEDHLPLRYAIPRWSGWVLDFLAPFLPGAGLQMEYRARREGQSIIVEGSSRREYDGEPIMATRATFDSRGGLEQIDVTVRGRTRSVRRVESDEPSSQTQATGAEVSVPAQ